MLDLARQRVKNELWQRANLVWKLHDGQLDLHEFLYDVQRRGVKVCTFRIARRFGKTFDFACFSTERCLAEEGIKIPFLAPTVKALRQIVLPIFQTILEDCPEHLRPKFSRQDSTYTFPSTGSEIVLGGTDGGHAEKMRGLRAKYGFLDEAGFMNDLRYIVMDIMLPTLMYDDGILGVSSTPPPSPDHYYVELVAGSEIKDASIHRTVWENPMIRVKEILEFADATGCDVDWQRFEAEHCEERAHDSEWAKGLIRAKSISFRREFEAEIVVDPEKAVIPELTEEKLARIVKDTTPPEFRKRYVTIDTGFIDFTGVTLGYYDFDRAKAVIEDDMQIDFSRPGMNLEKFVKMVRDKEKELWGPYPPDQRWADGDLIVLNELCRLGLDVAPVRKDALEAQVNQARTDIRRERVEIHSRARNTVAHGKYAIWNRQKTAFARSESLGHYDCLASFIYFLRHIDRGSNPTPDLHGVDPFQQYIPEDYGQNKSHEALKSIFRHGGR